MIEIKDASVNDLPLIRQLAFDIWPTAYGNILSNKQLEYMLDKMYSLASLEQQQQSLKHSFLIAYENNQPIGFASFAAHADDNNVYHLHKIYVLPQQQGKNVGRQMLDYVISQIKKTGAASLQLNVNRNNKALHFYEKQGFRIIHEEDIDIGEGYFMNDYVMELKC
jgi:diamine N-acetyltransferase